VSDEPEITAIGVKVLETIVLHAVDVIYWLDGTTAEAEGRMQRIERPLLVTFTQRPADIEVVSKAGQTAFRRRSDGLIFPGIATEAQKTRVPVTPFPLAGTVREAEGLYNARIFAVTLGSGAGHAVVLYPSPAGARLTQSGGLIGTLVAAANGNPVPWGLLELRVDVSGETMTFRAQADRNGDFALTMSRLPPTPQNVTDYAAQLSLKANLTADPAVPINTDLLDTVLLGEFDQNNFQENIDLRVRPGEVRKIHSLDVTYLAVQAV
jgi:hypothetical protein